MTKYWSDLQHPSLLSIACEAVGGNPDETTLVGAAMVLLTGAVDIHDDIIDHSVIKGSKQTVYGKFGKDIALLVGDALLIKGFKLLYDAGQKISAEKMASILSVTREAFFELGNGEAIELDFRGNLDVSPKEYMQIIRMKASILEAQARIGAIIGHGTQKEIEVLGEYGRILGVLGNIRDEFVDIFEPYEVHNRMVNECLPLPILYAFQNPETRNKIINLLRKKEMGEEDVDRLVNMVFEASEVKSLRKTMQQFAGKSISALKYLRKEKVKKDLRILVLSTLESL